MMSKHNDPAGDDRERNGLSGADLAGALEGEQIADLIDFVIQVAQETDLAGGTLRERVEDAEGQLAILRDKAIKLHAEILKRSSNQ
jgi:hypothetical protein